MNILRILLLMAFGVSLVRAQAPNATPPAVTPKIGIGTDSATPSAKSAFDDQLQKLTRSAWTWETAMGKSTIKFAKDGTCVHTRFNGTFEIQKDDTVIVNLPTRQQVLVFDFGKGEYTGYDSVLKQKITGAQEPNATPPAVTPKIGIGTDSVTPGAKSAFDAQLQKLTRSAWTWETAMGKNTIKFAKDGTCVHTRFNGTFEIQKDDTVIVNLPSRQQVLVFDFGKGEYTGYDSVLKQKITGAQEPNATPPAVTPKIGIGTDSVTPGAKSAFDAQLQKLTRSAWTWETAMGKNTIKFAKDGTCVHTRFNGTFEIQKDDTVIVNLPTRQQVLVFDFGKGEYTGYDSVLKQKITGKRTYQK